MHEMLEQVRARLLRWIRDENISCVDESCRETVLLAGSRLVGYRLSMGSAHAVWMLGEESFEVRSPGKSSTLVIGCSADSSQKDQAALRAA